MKLRHTRIEDYPRLLEIYSHAREMMKLNGNPKQWGDVWPPNDLVKQDIFDEISYVVTDENDFPIAVFAFIIGEDPTYKVIQGKWLNAAPYGTIHRIASDNSHPGIFHFVIEQLKSFNLDIRIDTSSTNKIMRHILEKEGFIYTGIIHIQTTLVEGSERLAFQKVFNFIK